MIDNSKGLTSLQRLMRDTEGALLREMQDAFWRLSSGSYEETMRNFSDLVASLRTASLDDVPEDADRVRSLIVAAQTVALLWTFQSQVGDPRFRDEEGNPLRIPQRTTE